MSCVITITTILSRIRFRNTDSTIQIKRRDFARYHGTSPVDTWQKSVKRIYNICSNVILNIMRRRWNKCRISLVMTVCYLRTGSDNGFLSISFSKPMSIDHRKIHRMSFNRNYTSRLHVFSETVKILIICMIARSMEMSMEMFFKTLREICYIQGKCHWQWARVTVLVNLLLYLSPLRCSLMSHHC